MAVSSADTEKARPRIRVETDGYVGHCTHVFYLTDDGEEVDISPIITGVDLKIRVGDVNTAVVTALFAGGAINAELEEFIVKDLRPDLGVKDVTTFLSGWRRWLRMNGGRDA